MNTNLYIGKCRYRGCGYTIRRTFKEIYKHDLNFAGERCPAHPEWKLKWDEITGIRNDNVKCGPKCQNAKGKNCECSCGGINHGANYA
jgi:hypothetical protein